MIDAWKAAQIAQEYLGEVYSDTQFQGLQLEELELTDDRDNWMITLSYITPGAIFTYPTPKDYKIFKISSTDGEVISMKIRQLKWKTHTSPLLL